MFLEIGNKFKQLYRWFIKPSPRLLGALSNYAKWSFIQYLIFTGLSWLVRNYVFQNKSLLQNDPEFSNAIAGDLLMCCLVLHWVYLKENPSNKN